jgi:phosphoenolpyruvate carboxykinase (GTP)
MLPFCGYHMADYFGHWLRIGERGDPDKLPKLFNVNWFRKDESGNFLWPGFGENSRVLAWIFRRCEGKADAVETPAGLVPTKSAIETEGLDVSDEQMEELLAVDPEQLAGSLPAVEEHFAKFGERLPPELREELAKLEQRLAVR